MPTVKDLRPQKRENKIHSSTHLTKYVEQALIRHKPKSRKTQSPHKPVSRAASKILTVDEIKRLFEAHVQIGFRKLPKTSCTQLKQVPAEHCVSATPSICLDTPVDFRQLKRKLAKHLVIPNQSVSSVFQSLTYLRSIALGTPMDNMPRSCIQTPLLSELSNSSDSVSNTTTVKLETVGEES